MPRPQDAETGSQGDHRVDDAVAAAAEISGDPDVASFTTSRRIAGATLIRAVGELVAKAASVVFFIAIARELGDRGFGDFIFGLSLSSVLFTAAGFGTEQLIARDVARDRRELHHLYGNVLAVKGLALVALMAALAVIVFAGDYSPTTHLAVMLIGLGVAFEVLGKTFHAIFQAHERMQFIAGSLIIQRITVAIAGIAVLVAGGGLVDVSIVFCLGGLLGLLSSLLWMYRFVVRPRINIDRSRWVALMRAGVPLGLASTLYYALLKLDASLLSFLKGGDNAEVGQYGAAYRLIEATMFVSWSFGGAIMPWLSRHRAEGSLSLTRGYELGLKALVAMLLPIAAFFGVYARPLIELLYGRGYAEAVTPLRLLAAMTILFGINTFLAILMISQDTPGEFARASAVVIVQNVIFNFILIPPLGAEGAALNAIVSGALLAGWTLLRARDLFGAISMRRVIAAPVAASACVIAFALARGSALTAVDVIAVAAVYLVALLGTERVIFPDDFRFYAQMRPRRASAKIV
jgi:O-antigen/teichoic acid export membrane protein